MGELIRERMDEVGWSVTETGFRPSCGSPFAGRAVIHLAEE